VNSFDKIGKAPGTVEYVGDKDFNLFQIDSIQCQRKEYSQKSFKTSDAISREDQKNTDLWIVQGLQKPELISKYLHDLGVENLTLEDIFNTLHRPKLDVLEEGVFCVLKIPSFDQKAVKLEIEHVCVLLHQGQVWIFCEQTVDNFKVLLDRFRAQKGNVPKTGPDYLFYAVLDFCIDQTLKGLLSLEDSTDELELQLLQDVQTASIQEIFELKSISLKIKRRYSMFANAFLAIKDWPVNFEEMTTTHLRDLRDQVQLCQSKLDSISDRCAYLIEFANLVLSNRTNDIMRILTMIATIFIPLGFLAGVFGMNFDIIPGLKHPWGFEGFIALSTLTTLITLAMFRHWKWL